MIDHDYWFIHHAAARCGNLEILKTIIDDNYDIDINSVDKYGRTILHIACLYGKFEVCKFLVSKFPNMAKERDVYGNPACVLAARGENSDAYNLLLGTSNSCLNEEDRKNMSDAANLSKLEISREIIIMMPACFNPPLTKLLLALKK